MNDLAVYQQGAKHHAEAAHYSRYYTLGQLKQFYSTASVGFICASIGSWALMSFFIGQFFAGAEFEHMDEWRFIQFVYAGMGMAIATAITIAEAVLFNSGRSREYWLVVGFAVGFSIFAETAATMQREQSTVAYRSTQSEVYKASIRAVDVLATTSTLTPSQVQLSRLQAAYDEAKRLGKRAAMDAIQARIARAENAAAMEQSNRTSALLSTIQQAKTLEYDETKHQAMIRFMAEVFGLSHVVSSALLAFFLILTFKICFHYLGAMRQLNARAIKINTGELSASIESFRVNPTTQQAAISQDAAASLPCPAPTPKPAGEQAKKPAKKPSPTLGMHEEQLAIELPANGDAAQVARATGIRVNTDKISPAMQARYDANESVGANNPVDCPWCNTSFMKRTYNHRFCKTACKDDWHNAQDPERLQYKGRGAV